MEARSLFMRRLQQRLFRRTDPHIAPQIGPERKEELGLFQRHAGIKFKNPELLNLAFCHRSYANERGEGIGNNERLEFYVNDNLFKITILNPRGCSYKWDLAVRHMQQLATSAAIV